MSKDSGGLLASAGPIIRPAGWVQIGVLAVLFIAFFRDMLFRAFGIAFEGGGLATRGYAWNNPNWSHALVVPLIALYFLYQHRNELRAAVHDPSRREAKTENVALALLVGFLPIAGLTIYLIRATAAEGQMMPVLHQGGIAMLAGLVGMLLFVPVRKPIRALLGAHVGEILLVLGIVGYILGIYPIRNDMAKGYSMILALGGLVWFLCGAKVSRIAWFPVFYMVFAIKLSDRLWEMIAFKLQGIAASTSGVAINLLGLPIGLEADVSGHTIQLIQNGLALPNNLNVEEACSGLRMLMTFIALGFAVAYLAERPWWARLAIVLMTVPIAIIVNVGRVTTLGLLAPYYPEATKGEAHIFIGLLMLIPALGLFMLLGWVLNKMIVTEADEAEAARPARKRVVRKTGDAS